MAQPEIPGTDVGKVGMPYGSDGSKWIAFLVDALGKLQVEIDASVLPTDAATETTLAALLTELALKADLTETQPVSAASLPLPTGAATETTLDAIKTAVEIVDGFADAQNLIFGYNAQYLDKAYNLSAGAGDNYLYLTIVPAGEVWVVTSIAGKDNTNNPTRIILGIYDGTSYYELKEGVTPGAGIAVSLNVPTYLKAGDKVFTLISGCVLNDDIFLTANGYKMKIA